MMKPVYICAPLGGTPKEIEQNIDNALIYSEYALRCGCLPLTPHIFALILDDNIPEERELGRKAGINMLWHCEELWIFGNEITKGMQAEIDFCNTFHKKIRKVKYGEIKKLIGGKKKQ